MEEQNYIRKDATDRDALGHLLGEHLYLKAQIETQKTFITLILNLLMKEQPDVVKKISADYPKLVRQNYDNLVANHYLLDGAWRKTLQDELRDIPGIDLLP